MIEVKTIDKAQLQSMGVEFECGYDRLDGSTYDEIASIVNDFRIDGDGSVSVKDRYNTSAELKFWSTDIANLTEAIDILITKANAKQNYTCSNHRHIRFTHANKILNEHLKLKKSLLQFRNSYLETFNEIKYIARLNNYYCRNSIEWSDSEIAYEFALKVFGSRAYCRYHDKRYEKLEFTKQYYERERYYFINFCAYRRHKTTEFRVYPHVESADEFHRQSEHLYKFINSFKPVYRTYRICDGFLNVYIARINRKFLCIEIAKNEYAKRLLSLSGFANHLCDYNSLVCFEYADRSKKAYRLSEVDSTEQSIIENNKLNYVVFRILRGYWKIPIEAIGNMAVKDFVDLFVSEFENFKNTLRSKFKIELGD